MTVRANKLRVRLGQLSWHESRAKEEQVNSAKELNAAAARQARAPALQGYLETVQARQHEQTVGAYEAILTELVHEVLGPVRDVKLSTGFRNSQPALDIDVLHGDHLEDVLEGNGGALTNVICAGLRFAVIARSGKRRFLVLDEPDCWIKPERVPAFVRALDSVCVQAGFQALMVSHHPIEPEDLPESVSVVTLFTNPDTGQVEASSVLSAPVEEGILSVHAVDYRTHTNTKALLGPGLTLLTGDNNLGKSALTSGIRVLARGGATDAHIRHDEESLSYTLELRAQGVEHVLNLVRVRKGSPRVTLQHFVKGEAEPRHVERGSQHSVPGWVSELLDMDTIEGLDPQLTGQKSPVFLLDEPASTRAKLLYAGREAAILAKMFALHRQQTREDDKTVTRLQAVLANLTHQIDAVRTLPTLTTTVEALAEQEAALESKQSKATALRQFIPKVERVTAVAAVRVPDAVQSIAVPALRPTLELQRLAKQISRIQRSVAAYRPVAMPEVPELKDTIRLHRMGVSLNRLQSFLARVQLPPLPEAPVLHPAAELNVVLSNLNKAAATVARYEKEQREVQAQVAAVEAQLADLLASLGETCPVCQQPMAHHEKGVTHV